MDPITLIVVGLVGYVLLKADSNGTSTLGTLLSNSTSTLANLLKSSSASKSGGGSGASGSGLNGGAGSGALGGNGGLAQILANLGNDTVSAPSDPTTDQTLDSEAPASSPTFDYGGVASSFADFYANLTGGGNGGGGGGGADSPGGADTLGGADDGDDSYYDEAEV